MRSAWPSLSLLQLLSTFAAFWFPLGGSGCKNGISPHPFPVQSRLLTLRRAQRLPAAALPGGQARDVSVPAALVDAALQERPFGVCFRCCSQGRAARRPPRCLGSQWVPLLCIFIKGNIKNRWHLLPLVHRNEVWYYSLFFVTSRSKLH